MPPLRGPVLIVEDDFDIREALQGYLELHGYAVRVARHGREALEQAVKEPRPAVVVLDMVLPVMNGHRVLTARQEEASLAGIPVLILSASVADMSPRDKARYATAYDVAALLPKPVEPPRLLEAIERHALRAEGTSPGAPT